VLLIYINGLEQLSRVRVYQRMLKADIAGKVCWKEMISGFSNTRGMNAAGSRLLIYGMLIKSVLTIQVGRVTRPAS
jgi:hypothetical protein